MATTVHLPEDLLERLDARARALRVSRNRLIIETLSSALDKDDEWSPELLAAIETPLSDEAAEELDEMIAAVRQHRGSKPPPDLE